MAVGSWQVPLAAGGELQGFNSLHDQFLGFAFRDYFLTSPGRRARESVISLARGRAARPPRALARYQGTSPIFAIIVKNESGALLIASRPVARVPQPRLLFIQARCRRRQLGTRAIPLPSQQGKVICITAPTDCECLRWQQTRGRGLAGLRV